MCAVGLFLWQYNELLTKSIRPLRDHHFHPFTIHYAWKMMTMVTGEMDYESIFCQSSSATLDPDPPLPFPEISYVLWIL